MKESEKSATKAETQRNRSFGFKNKCGVVEAKFFECVLQCTVIGAICGIYAGIDHRQRLFKAGKRFGGRVINTRYSVTNLCFGNIFDTCREISDLAGVKPVAWSERKRGKRTCFNYREFRTGVHHPDIVANTDGAIHYAEIDDYALVRVVI